jgi:hypothetical protein
MECFAPATLVVTPMRVLQEPPLGFRALRAAVFSAHESRRLKGRLDFNAVKTCSARAHRP